MNTAHWAVLLPEVKALIRAQLGWKERSRLSRTCRQAFKDDPMAMPRSLALAWRAYVAHSTPLDMAPRLVNHKGDDMGVCPVSRRTRRRFHLEVRRLFHKMIGDLDEEMYRKIDELQPPFKLWFAWLAHPEGGRICALYLDLAQSPFPLIAKTSGDTAWVSHTTVIG